MHFLMMRKQGVSGQASNAFPATHAAGVFRWQSIHIQLRPYSLSVQAPAFSPALGVSTQAGLPDDISLTEAQPAHLPSLEEMQDVLLDEQQPSLHDWAAAGPAVGVSQGLPEPAAPWQQLDPHPAPRQQASMILQSTPGSLLLAWPLARTECIACCAEP